MENEQSKRSTPSTITFLDQQREYGYNSLREQVKKPESTVMYLHNLLGSVNTSHEYFFRTFQPISLTQNQERNSTSIKIGKEALETEEIMAMIIQHALENSEKFGEGSVKDCTITVPSFWNQSQRSAMINAAQAAGLQVLALMHENTGAAFYYGIDRLDNETDHLALFYNLGASYLQVTLARYSSVEKTVKTTKQIENVEILAHASDSTLGGSLFDSLIAKRLAEKFQELHGYSLFSISKAMVRLFQQANQAKKTLSANKSTLVIVNSLYKGIDFSYTLTREEFENMILPYTDRLVSPILEVLRLGNVDIKDINSLEIIGGVSRIPKVQEVIKERTGMDTSSHLNGDESIAHGAAIYAANFSSVVQVRPMWLSDVNTQVLSVRFYSENYQEWSKDAILFKYGAKLGSTKKITFGYNKDVNVLIEEGIGSEKIPILEYKIRGVEDIVKDDISLYFSFRLDESGIVTLESADAVYDTKKNKKTDGNEESSQKEETEKNEEKSGSAEENNSETSESSGKSGTEKVENIDPEKSDSESKENDSESNTTSEKSDSKSKGKKSKSQKTVSLKISETDLKQPKVLSKKDVKRISERLASFKDSELQAKKLAEARNDFESYIYLISDKLEDEKFIKVSSKSTRFSVSEYISELKDWMELSEFENAPRHEIKKKKRELESLVTDALVRESELGIREETIENAYKELGRLEESLTKLNEAKPWIPENEIKLATVALNEIIEWVNSKFKEQKMLEDWEPLAFRCSEVESKVTSIKKQVEKLKKIQKPKEKSKKDKPEFINLGDNVDWKNIKMENVKVDGQDYNFDGEKDSEKEPITNEETKSDL